MCISQSNFMLNAKGRITPLARIFPVPRLSFVSQRTAYASETGKMAREKPRPKADDMLTENHLGLLNATTLHSEPSEKGWTERARSIGNS